jgi:hypothetical protein
MLAVQFVRDQRISAMKVFVTVLALAALAANVAVAKTVKADNRGPFYSHAQGYQQAYENPDGVYGTANEPAAQ